MFKKIIAAVMVAASTLGAMAQHDTMYLIKEGRVVGKYAVNDVDYATFTLPGNVVDQDIWVTLENVGKNEVTYTINTVNPIIGYAHNLVSFYDANYVAMDYFGESFDSLTPELQTSVLQLCLKMSAYAGIDTQTYTQHDFRLDGTGENNRFSVVPGTKYFLCIWQIDVMSQEPTDFFTYVELTTEAPARSNASLTVTQGNVNDHGVEVNFAADSDIVYVRTAWGVRRDMDFYVSVYGLDFLLGTFGQAWTLDFLNGTGDFSDDTPNSTWVLTGDGQYVMYARGYDRNGDIVDVRTEVNVNEDTEDKGPEITALSRDKGDGFVSLTFEISPSNVLEAYVRMCEENFVDGRLNAGYQLWEIAAGGDAIDISDTINKFGEYTFKATDVDDKWYSIVVMAKDKDGRRTARRFSFNTVEGSKWYDEKPVYTAPAKRLPADGRIHFRSNPTLKR